MRKYLYCVLLLTAAAVLVSCGGKDTGPVNADTSSAGIETAPADTTPVTTGVYDTIDHDVKYDDRDYNILQTSQHSHCNDDFSFHDSGTVMDNAIFHRNAAMEDNYGIIIENRFEAGSTGVGLAKSVIQKAYTSGESEYDLYVVAAYDAASLALSRMFLDLKNTPHVDLEREWWDQAANRDLHVANKMFFTHGSLSTNMDDYTFCVLFNKKLYNESITDGTDVYQLVRDGKWTTERMGELAKGISKDLNGDDKMDSHDLYGLMLWDDELLATFHAAGQRIADVNGEGMIVPTLFSERSSDVISQFIKLGTSDYAINFQHMTGGVSWMDMFAGDQVLFMMEMFNEISRFRDMDTDYGILPNPKYDEEQQWYSPVAAWHCSFICISSVIGDPDYVGYATELLGYHSRQLITPAYYEKTLYGAYVRDEQSRECLDIIFNNRVYDIGHFYKIVGMQETITNLLRNNQPDGLAQMSAAMQRAFTTAVNSQNKVIAKILEEAG